MGRRIATLGTLGLSLLALSPPAFASGGTALGQTLSPWSVSAFVLMLLSIAVLPQLLPDFWEGNGNKLLVSLVLGLPIIGILASADPGALLDTGRDYVSFIVMLGSLFVISGGILVKANLRATPGVNCTLLALGSLLASFMGTTGAAMLLIRPLLETNKERTRVAHTVIFFIFLVGNIGGGLSPLGDPPLFMGYLAGIPFTWFLRLWPQWLLSTGVLLAVYYLWDRRQFSCEPAEALAADRANVQPLRVTGLRNLPLLAGVVVCVALLHGEVAPFPVREAVLVALAALSWWLTPRALRAENKFSFNAIVEVAVLFFGIFATMIPAILILRARGGELGVSSPASFFWASGGLSSFLDNTPTWVVFFALAQGLGLPAGSASVASTGVAEPILKAICLGAVFMGANTYIGNAPNFMVKSIAEERGVKMPSFFGYMLYALAVLVPLFALLTVIFFR